MKHNLHDSQVTPVCECRPLYAGHTKWVRKTFLTIDTFPDTLRLEGTMSEIRLTAAQRAALRACLEIPPSTGFYRRAAALLALDEGQPVAAVAELLGVTRQGVYNWAQAYQQSPRPEALWDRCGGGRPSLWTQRLQALLEEALRHRPDEWGYPGLNWTVPLLRAYL